MIERERLFLPDWKDRRREWFHVGGDLEASYDGARYVDFRDFDGERVMFASRETLLRAVDLFKNPVAEDVAVRPGDRVKFRKAAGGPGFIITDRDGVEHFFYHDKNGDLFYDGWGRDVSLGKPIKEALAEADEIQRRAERRMQHGEDPAEYYTHLRRHGGAPAHFAGLSKEYVDALRGHHEASDRWHEARDSDSETRKRADASLQTAADRYYAAHKAIVDAAHHYGRSAGKKEHPTLHLQRGDASVEDHMHALASLSGIHRRPTVEHTAKATHVTVSQGQDTATPFGFKGVDEFTRAVSHHYKKHPEVTKSGSTAMVHVKLPRDVGLPRLRTESNDEVLSKLRDSRMPDEAPEGKAYVILWADGRAIVAFRKKADAAAFIEHNKKGFGQGDVVWVHLDKPYTKRGTRITVRNSFSPSKTEQTLLVRMPLHEAPMQEEREVNKDGTISCGIFLPIPFNLAKDFPDKSKHDDSVPHFTILYVGDCSPDAYKVLCNVVRKAAAQLKPFQLDLSAYGEFVNEGGLKIAHMRPGLSGSMRLALLHGVLRRALEQAKVEVGHSYGKNAVPGLSFESQFLPHATLNYLLPDEPYTGPKPSGSWRVTEIECWGHEKIRIPLGVMKYDQPTGLTREVLAISYPMAVPNVEPDSNIKSEAKDQISGGLADKSKPSEFSRTQLAMGMKVEREHTKDSKLAREIAMDHLKENPNYYTALKKMEKQFESETSLSGGETHHGLGGSDGDIGLAGSLPMLSLQKRANETLRRRKLKGLS